MSNAWWLDTYRTDWLKNRTPADSTMQRPTEQTAFARIAEQVARYQATGGATEFDAFQWRVYMADMRLRYNHQNLSTVTPFDIARHIHCDVDSVERALQQIDNICENRYALNMSALPDVPVTMQSQMRKIEKMRKAA